MLNIDLLKKLCEASGVSGDEANVRNIIIDEISGYADGYSVDKMGNLIVFKKGNMRAETRLMICAHMDEVGFIITDITNEGMLRFTNVGGIDSDVICGKSVLIGENSVRGVMGLKPTHLVEADEKGVSVPLDDLYIDIGAESREEAESAVKLGDTACFESIFDFSGGMIKAKALDDRAGCFVLIELIKSDLPFDMHFAFVVQEEVGLRGARAVAYTINPDAAIVVEATTAADIYGVDEDAQVCNLRNGAAVSFMDKVTIYDREYYNLALRSSDITGVKVQPKRAVAGGNDAGSIHSSKSGVRTVAISIPCRYLHSSCGMIAQEDLISVEKTVIETAKNIIG